MFLGVLAPLCDRQQIVDTVSAAPLEPTRPARPYRRAPFGIHLHASHSHFAWRFALSRYKCRDPGAVRLQENVPPKDPHPRPGEARARHVELILRLGPYAFACCLAIFAVRGADCGWP